MKQSEKPFEITYTNKDGIAVTNYGMKNEIEQIADELANQGINFKVEVNKNEQTNIKSNSN